MGRALTNIDQLNLTKPTSKGVERRALIGCQESVCPSWVFSAYAFKQLDKVFVWFQYFVKQDFCLSYWHVTKNDYCNKSIASAYWCVRDLLSKSDGRLGKWDGRVDSVRNQQDPYYIILLAVLFIC